MGNFKMFKKQVRCSNGVVCVYRSIDRTAGSESRLGAAITTATGDMEAFSPIVN